MSLSFTISRRALSLGAAMAGAEETKVEKLEREVRQLKLQNLNLNKSLIEANQEIDNKTKALKEIKEHLALFGKDFSKAEIPSSFKLLPTTKSPAKTSSISREPFVTFFPSCKTISAPLLPRTPSGGGENPRASRRSVATMLHKVLRP